MLKTQIDNGFSCVIFQFKRLFGLCLFHPLKSSLCAEHVVRPSRMKQPFFFKDVSVFPKNKKRPTAAPMTISTLSCSPFLGHSKVLRNFLTNKKGCGLTHSLV